MGSPARQGEKDPRLVHGLAEPGEIAVTGDQIEQIAMLAGRGIGPFAGRARTVIGTLQPHIEASSRRVLDIADDPVAARAASFGEVVAAHGLGIAREAARQIGGGADHGSSRDQAAARALARSSGWRSRSAARIARSAILGDRHEQAQAPGDDFRGEAERLQLRNGTVGIAGELDAIRVHHQRAADLQIAGEIEDGAAIEHGAPGFRR